jgi:hypothetical protein
MLYFHVISIKYVIKNTTSIAINIILGKLRAINPSSLIKILGILCTSYFCPDKSGRQVFLCFVSLNIRVIFEFDRSSIL